MEVKEVRGWLALASRSPVTRCGDTRRTGVWRARGESSVVRVELGILTCCSSKALPWPCCAPRGPPLLSGWDLEAPVRPGQSPGTAPAGRALCPQPCPPSLPAAVASKPGAHVSPAHGQGPRAPGRIRTTVPAPDLQSAWPCFLPLPAL